MVGGIYSRLKLSRARLKHIAPICGCLLLLSALGGASSAGDTYVVSIDTVPREQGAEVADKLKDKGVTSEDKTTKLTNPTKAQVESAVDALKPKLKDGDQLMIVFNGHGRIVPDDDPPGADETIGDYFEPQPPPKKGRFDKAWALNGGFLRDDELAALLKRNLPNCAVAVIVSPSCMGLGMFDGGKKNIKQSVPNVIIGAPPGSKNKVEGERNCIDNFSALRDGPFSNLHATDSRQDKKKGATADLNNDGKVTAEEWLKGAGLEVANSLDANHSVPTLVSNAPIEPVVKRTNGIRLPAPQKLNQDAPPPNAQRPRAIVVPFSGKRASGTYSVSPTSAALADMEGNATTGPAGQRLTTVVGRDFENTRQTHYGFNFEAEGAGARNSLAVGRVYVDGRLVDSDELGGEQIDQKFQVDFPLLMPKGKMTVGLQLVEKDTMETLVRARAMYDGQLWQPVGTWDHLPASFADFAGNPATGTDYMVDGTHVFSISALEQLVFAGGNERDASTELANAFTTVGATLVHTGQGRTLEAFHVAHFEFVLPDELVLSSFNEYILAVDIAQAVPEPTGLGAVLLGLAWLAGARRGRAEERRRVD